MPSLFHHRPVRRSILGLRQCQRIGRDQGLDLFRRLRRSARWMLAHPTGRWLVLGGAVGLLSGVIGAVFQVATDLLTMLVLERIAGLPEVAIATHPTSHGTFGPLAPLWLLVALVAGGGLTGWLTTRFAAEARGGGTGQAVQAFHQGRGRIPLQVPLTKLLASVATLGTGGSGGREGPVSLMGAGIASAFATRLGLTVRDHRILLVAGIAGGIAAVFRAPLAASLFAVEVLYRGPELEAEALIPAFIAAVVAYLVAGLGVDVMTVLVGLPGVVSSTMFAPPPVTFLRGDWLHLVGYTAVALAAVAAGRWMVLVQGFAGRRFAALAVPAWSRPAIGAGLAGLIALAGFLVASLLLPTGSDPTVALATIGGGYGIVHWLFAGGADGFPHLALGLLLAGIAVLKAVTTACTVGSEGSAGLFGPCIVIGGCIGGAVGLLLYGLPIGPPPAACVLMGMAGLLSATHRTPVAALLMVSEVAGNYLLLLPAMWVSGISFLLMGRRSLVGPQVLGLDDSPAHRRIHHGDVLAQAVVADAVDPARAWVVLDPGLIPAEIAARIQAVHQDVFPVVADGRLLGLIDREDLATADRNGSPDPSSTPSRHGTAAGLAGGGALALRPDQPLVEALARFRAEGVDELPIIATDGTYQGMLGLASLLEFYRRQMEQESRSDSSARQPISAITSSATES